MSTESPKTYFFWSGNALPDPPCYDQYTDDDDDDGDDDDYILETSPLTRAAVEKPLGPQKCRS